MRTSWIAGIVAALIVALVVVQIVRPVAKPTLADELPTSLTIAGSKPSLPWPAGVQADAEVAGVGVWPQHGPSQPVPIGSIAKMMTAYLVLSAHPLSVGQSGPSLPVTTQDVQLYTQDAQSHQSVMAVSAGERLSELTLLEGVLVPSGNNVATMLADWITGSPFKFAQEMNRTAAKLGLTHTHYHGPVGLDPSTASTAADQMKLAAIFMQNPVFRQIVAMPQLQVPGQAQLEYNYNNLVGHQGIIGVKTGSTVQAGGCVVLAKQVTVGQKTMTVYSSVMGQPAIGKTNQLQASLNDANTLLQKAAKVVGTHTVITQGEKLAQLNAPWQSPIPLVATKPVQFLGWPGLDYSVHLSLKMPHEKTVPAGTVVGTATAQLGSQTVTIPVKTAKALTAPGISYRIVR